MADWHPIMAAVEGPTGTWRMTDPVGREYGLIELRRVNDEKVLYKATRDGVVLGWATTLRVACSKLHAAMLSDMGPRGGPVASWGG